MNLLLKVSVLFFFLLQPVLAADITIQTTNGKILSVSSDNDLIQIWVNYKGDIVKTEVLDDSFRHDKILIMVPYEDNSLVAYTASHKLIVKHNLKANTVIGEKWNVKNMSVIGNELFILTNDGYLATKNIKTKAVKILQSKGSWSDIISMIAVGPNLIILKNTAANKGEIHRVNPVDSSVHVLIGKGWDPASKIVGIDKDNVVIKTGSDAVSIKNIHSGANDDKGAFVQGMFLMSNFYLNNIHGLVVIVLPPQGARLFEVNKIPQDLAQDRKNFLINTKITEPITGRFALNNKYVDYKNQANSPMFFGYIDSTDAVKFTAKLSEDFRANLPEGIKNALKPYPIETLDIFFTPQKFDGKGFKAHAWAANPPKASFPKSTVYGAKLPMGLFKLEHNQGEVDLPIGKLKMFPVTVHNNTFSPQKPEIKWDAGNMNNSYLWTLVIDPINRKAAATLHWMLWGDQNEEIVELIKKDMPDATLQSLHGHLQNSSNFKGTAMLKELEDLLRL